MATKITKFVISGLRTEDEQVFMNRVAELIEKFNLLEPLTEGVLTEVKIDDKKELIAYLNQLTKRTVIDVTEISINELKVYVRYVYAKTKWYKTEKDKEEKSYEWKEHKDSDYTVESCETINNSTFIDKNAPGISVKYV